MHLQAALKQAGAWPAPALATWAAAWAVFLAVRQAAGAEWFALATACLVGGSAALINTTPWRRAWIAGGFPLSLLASGSAAAVPAWAWLLPLALLALIYPASSWRDAPLFPTPVGALSGLSAHAPLPEGARILDVGCGSGAGLRELRRAYPGAQLMGVERSRLLRWICAWRCPDARITCADLWKTDWSACDMVYVFQRPDTMSRIAAKATAEMKPGRWLVSLDFEVAEWEPSAKLYGDSRRTVWAYRLAGKRA